MLHENIQHVISNKPVGLGLHTLSQYKTTSEIVALQFPRACVRRLVLKPPQPPQPPHPHTQTTLDDHGGCGVVGV